MTSISDTINGLIIKTSGGLLVLWLASSYFVVKFLRWCGEKVAEGANRDLVNKLMPTIEAKFDQKLNTLERLVSNDIQEIKIALNIYKNEKHRVEGENINLKEAIILNDQEIFKELKSVFSHGK